MHQNKTQNTKYILNTTSRTQLDNIITLLIVGLPVVIKDSQYEPDSPEDDQSVNVTKHHHGSYQTVEDQQDLTEVEAPALVVDVVQQGVRKWSRVWDFLVGQGQTGRGGEEARPEPEEAEQCFDSLLRHRVFRVLTEIITGRLGLLTGRGKFSWVVLAFKRLQQ